MAVAVAVTVTVAVAVVVVVAVTAAAVAIAGRKTAKSIIGPPAPAGKPLQDKRQGSVLAPQQLARQGVSSHCDAGA